MDFHVSRRTIAVLGAIPFVLLLLGVYIQMRDPGNFDYLLVPGIFLALLVAWALGLRITVTEVDLTYRGSLFMSRRIRLEDIETAWVESGWARYSDRFRPMIRLVVQPKKGTSAPGRFDMNLRPFALADVHRLLRVLEQRGVLRNKLPRRADEL